MASAVVYSEYNSREMLFGIHHCNSMNSSDRSHTYTPLACLSVCFNSYHFN